jgi:hypothetical protein
MQHQEQPTVQQNKPPQTQPGESFIENIGVSNNIIDGHVTL